MASYIRQYSSFAPFKLTVLVSLATSSLAYSFTRKAQSASEHAISITS